MQGTLTVSEDRPEHLAYASSDLAFRPRRRSPTSTVHVSTERRSSASESPPNFSTSASASVSATMASPTTAAAGTAQTSLRSMAAPDSVSVVRST